MKLTARDLCHSVVLLLAVLTLPAQAQFEGPTLLSIWRKCCRWNSCLT